MINITYKYTKELKYYCLDFFNYCSTEPLKIISSILIPLLIVIFVGILSLILSKKRGVRG